MQFNQCMIAILMYVLCAMNILPNAMIDKIERLTEIIQVCLAACDVCSLMK